MLIRGTLTRKGFKMFYTYRQNNSGGFFRGPAKYVIIEAHNREMANSLAELHDVYFDGCEAGADCSCCGDRWYRTYDKGTKSPEIYGKTIQEHVLDDTRYVSNYSIPVAIVHYLDGRQSVYKEEPEDSEDM